MPLSLSSLSLLTFPRKRLHFPEHTLGLDLETAEKVDYKDIQTPCTKALIWLTLLKHPHVFNKPS